MLINGAVVLPRNVHHVWGASRVDLRPFLFDIFMDYFPLCVSPKFVSCDSFADDGTLNTANDNTDNIRRDLQQSLDNVSDWCRTNLIGLNQTEQMHADGD